MTLWLILILIGAVLALAAAGFVVLPALRRGGEERRRPGLFSAGLAGFLVLAAGLGAYAVLGRPDYALMSLRNAPDTNNFPQAIAYLSQIIRERPNDIQGWTILGRGYLGLGDPLQARGAFERAIEIETAQRGNPSPELLVDYAIAWGLSVGGFDQDVQEILVEALSLDPGNADARYYLGLAYAERGNTEGALSMWDGLLAIAPPNAPWRAALPNQIAALMSEARDPASGGGPDIRAMVDGLAARLSEEPEDLEGWAMLIRAYAVLGETENAHAALDNARQVFAGNDEAQAALTEQARASSLE